MTNLLLLIVAGAADCNRIAHLSNPTYLLFEYCLQALLKLIYLLFSDSRGFILLSEIIVQSITK